MTFSNDPSLQPGLRLLLDALPDPLLLLDPHGLILNVNRAFERATGKAQAQLIGRPIWEAFPHMRDEKLERAFRRVMRTQQAEHLEAEVPGARRWLDVRIFPLQPGVGVEYRDITEQKREQLRNLELAVRNAALEAEAQALQAYAQLTESASLSDHPGELAEHAVNVLCAPHSGEE